MDGGYEKHTVTLVPRVSKGMHMVRFLQLMMVLSTLSLASFVLAEEPEVEESSEQKNEVEVRYKAKTEIDFGVRKVAGAIDAPAGVYSASLADAQWNPLIRLKTNFEPEITASVEEIR